MFGTVKEHAKENTFRKARKVHWGFGFMRSVFYSFPLQLLFIHLKKNTVLVIIWAVLFGIITGQIGKEYGIPYLFLDPEYEGRVDWFSMLIMGISMGGFVMAFQITSYSLESNRFTFLGYLRKPFGKFFLNNLLIPAAFLFFYGLNFIRFQTESESLSIYRILLELASFFGGFILFVLLFFYYLVGTNKDIFVVLGPSVARSSERRRLKRMDRLIVRPEAMVAAPRITYYLESVWKIRKANHVMGFKPESIQQVFAQNHLNGILMEVALVVAIFMLGIFGDRSQHHIPAGASLLLFFTLLVMIAGWASYWFKDWTVAAILFVAVCFNALTLIWYRGNQGATGLSYSTGQAAYTIDRMKTLASDTTVHNDKRLTTAVLENWKKRTGERLPRIVFICASGGGQRSAVWTMSNLKYADSIVGGGGLMKHTVLITGASGGMIGAAYYRELYLRHKLQRKPFTVSEKNIEAVGKDNLNAIMFNLVVNDIFFRSLNFSYKGKTYYRDRGHALEEQINQNTGGIMDKTLSEYRGAEAGALIPMMILSPTIINDGRKLYISPLPISYMTRSDSLWSQDSIRHVQGIEFTRFYREQGSSNLSFLSALRMNATFPYITPNVELPSEPAMEVIDAGMTDNYGIDDALKFAYNFRGWIKKNTSGIVILSLRDAPSEKLIAKQRRQTLIERFISTIGGFYAVWEDIQNNYNDAAVEYAKTWSQGKLVYLEVPYIPDFSKGTAAIRVRPVSRDSISLKVVRSASLSWHLTRFEKENLKQSLLRPANLQTYRRLKELVDNR